MTEFRKYGRAPLAGTVRVKHRELGEIHVEDGNISATGLFLKLGRTNQWVVGEEFAAELPSQQGVPSHTRTWLKVVRVANDGIGVTIV